MDKMDGNTNKKNLWNDIIGIGFSKVSVKTIVIWSVLLLTVYFIFTLVYGALGILPISTANESVAKMTKLQKLIFVFIFSVFVAPFFEEVVFRGYLFNWLKRLHVRTTIIVISTAFFWTIMHFLLGMDFNFPIFVYFLTMGALLCISRIRTSSLLTPLILHSVYNTASVIIILINN